MKQKKEGSQSNLANITVANNAFFTRNWRLLSAPSDPADSNVNNV